ncbi:MAG: GWxTD domain-containing protein [Melioribacteraceae bacterium]|nr:GWxTD domain-containing protein [Melioribacteraceae bacterium]
MIKNFNYLLCSIIFVVTFQTTLHSQENQEEINLQIDFAQFKGNDEGTLLEIFYSIPRNSILHYETEKGVQGEYLFNCKVYLDDSLVDSLNWIGSDFTESKDDILANQTINDYHLLLLRPNLYKIHIQYLNSNNEVKFSTQKDIEIKNFNDDQLKQSSIQLCLNINKAENNNRFAKNGYQLTLNPSGIFGSQWPVLYYYSEIYGLNKMDDQSDSSYSVISNIRGQQGEILKELPVKKNLRLGSSLVNVGQTFVGSLKSGAYDLELKVIDHSTGDSNKILKRFYIYRPVDFIASNQKSEEESNKLSSTFIGFSEEELDREFQFVKYIANDQEKDNYEMLNLAGKREFMVRFWTSRNSPNAMDELEYRREYFDRIDFANRRYSAGGKKGWKSSPGRVILVYGIPDELDKFTSQATLNQYEIWQYHNVQGGVQFVFVDDSGYGDLRLVHSTAVNEIQDYQWQQRFLQN